MGDETCKTFTTIELPAKVNDLNTLEERLNITDEQVEFILSERMPHAKAIGEFQPANALLLKVTKSADGTVTDTEICGKIDRFVRFRRTLLKSYESMVVGLMDFQMDPPPMTEFAKDVLETVPSFDLDQLDVLSNQFSDDNWRQRQIQEEAFPSIPPPRFTSSDFPYQISGSVSSGAFSEVQFLKNLTVTILPGNEEERKTGCLDMLFFRQRSAKCPSKRYLLAR